jgi:hypothetical protein
MPISNESSVTDGKGTEKAALHADGGCINGHGLACGEQSLGWIGFL